MRHPGDAGVSRVGARQHDSRPVRGRAGSPSRVGRCQVRRSGAAQPDRSGAGPTGVRYVRDYRSGRSFVDHRAKKLNRDAPANLTSAKLTLTRRQPDTDRRRTASDSAGSAARSMSPTIRMYAIDAHSSMATLTTMRSGAPMALPFAEYQWRLPGFGADHNDPAYTLLDLAALLAICPGHRHDRRSASGQEQLQGQRCPVRAGAHREAVGEAACDP